MHKERHWIRYQLKQDVHVNAKADKVTQVAISLYIIMVYHTWRITTAGNSVHYIDDVLDPGQILCHCSLLLLSLLNPMNALTLPSSIYVSGSRQTLMR